MCKCNKENWRVIDRKCNYSAFNGYRKTESEYSLIRCNNCKSRWRTKAKYVEKLKDLKEELSPEEIDKVLKKIKTLPCDLSTGLYMKQSKVRIIR